MQWLSLLVCCKIAASCTSSLPSVGTQTDARLLLPVAVLSDLSLAQTGSLQPAGRVRAQILGQTDACCNVTADKEYKELRSSTAVRLSLVQ